MSNSLYRYAGLGNVKATGLSTQAAATRLHHLEFAERRLVFFCVAHLVGSPSRDLKLLLGRAQFLAGARCTALRSRLREMRFPRVRIDSCPSAALELALDEALHCETEEEIAAVGHRLHAELISTYLRYLEETNSLADAPSCDLINSQLPLLRQIAESLRAFCDKLEHRCSVARVEQYLSAAGGLDGAGVRTQEALNRQRSTKPFEIRRQAGSPPEADTVWDYSKPPMEDTSEYLLYMLGIRLSEINVAEGLAVVMYETPGKPWEFYQDLSRHLWDEMRHSMMGEAAIETIYGNARAVPMREYERVYCMEALPLEQYATLGIEIEGGQMKYPVGKRGEWEFCRDAVKNPLVTTFQDFDWADEVLHVSLAKKQLTDWFPGGPQELLEFARQGGLRRTEVKKRQAAVNLSVPPPPASSLERNQTGEQAWRP